MDQEQIVEKCKEGEGCKKIVSAGEIGMGETGHYCQVYAFPDSKWCSGKVCPLATNIQKEVKKEEKMVNPLKQSKRAAAGK